MANVFDKTKEFIKKHKVITGIIVIVLLGFAYYIYGVATAKKAATSYVTSTAALGTLTTSVSGSGQVSASNSVSLQFQASGTLTYLGVQNGQNVSAGQLIASLDTTNAQESITSDQANLQSAQISLQKLEGASTLSVPQNEQDATNALNQDYQTGYNTVSNTFVDLPAIMTDLQNTIYGNSFNNYQQDIDFYTSTAESYDPNAAQYKTNLTKSYQTALTEYTKNFSDYQTLSRTSDNSAIDSIITETYSTTKDVSQALKDTNNLIQFYENTLATYNIKPNPIATTQLATVNADAAKADTDATNLLNEEGTINTDKENVSNSSLNLQSAQLAVQNAQNSLANDKKNLSNYYIYAPYDGTIGNVTVQNLAQVGSGTSIATLITSQKIATIPLNEVDVSNVVVGQPAVITFNALPNLSVAGTVASINPIGTVSSGVVTYNVQIGFDTQDARVKSGMSMTANIITNVKQNVLLVPNAAVKTSGASKYVMVLVNNVPQTKVVTVGLTNSTQTEIDSGLNVGDKVITQTISSASATTSSTATGSSSSVRIPGLTGGGGGGGGFRAGGL